MNKFRLDKTAFKIQSVKNADESMRDSRHYSSSERFEIAFYLTSVAYGFDMQNPPRMDKTIFRIRKHD